MNLEQMRNNHTLRIVVIVLLMLLVVVLYFRNVNTGNMTTTEGVKGELTQNIKPDTWEKKLLLGTFAILGGALGMEATETDYDVGKLIKGEGLANSKVLRDKEGNVVTDPALGKATDEYNCDDFKSQPESQRFFVKAGGKSNDMNRLDGDKDGNACESLPMRAR
jgi:hypothetical protein